MDNIAIKNAMTIRLDNVLPEYPKFVEGIRRAPDRGFRLTKAQAETALRNALRYVPEELHEALAPEFLIRSSEYFTSALVMVFPLWNFTPSWRCMV